MPVNVCACHLQNCVCTNSFTVSCNSDDGSDVEVPVCDSGSDSDDDDEEEVVPRIRLSRKKEMELKRSEMDWWTNRRNNPLYPSFRGVEGPAQRMDPGDHDALDYFRELWGGELFELLANETNRYAYGKPDGGSWVATTANEIKAFLGIVILMGFHRLPRIADYWSRSEYVGVSGVYGHMTYSRFAQLWRRLHVVDNESADRADNFNKIRPIINRLKERFSTAYHPGQELSLDETMIKCKGRAKGKVFMPKKPIKRGFKMYSLSCACCGYLCDFHLCSSKHHESDPVTGKQVRKPEKVADVVKELLIDMYGGHNHVVYMDRFFPNGPLVEELRVSEIYTVGTIKRNALGFPQQLRNQTPPAGVYLAVACGDTNYYVFSDRKVVCFVTNVFPLHTRPMWRKEKGGEGFMRESDSVPPLVPAYNFFMGGVDRTNQMCGRYITDHRCVRPWMRVFIQLLHLAVVNAYLLYKHNCRLHGKRYMSSEKF